MKKTLKIQEQNQNPKYWTKGNVIPIHPNSRPWNRAKAEFKSFSLAFHLTMNLKV